MGWRLFRFVVLGAIGFGLGCGSRQPAVEEHSTDDSAASKQPSEDAESCVEKLNGLDFGKYGPPPSAKKCSAQVDPLTLLTAADNAMNAGRVAEGLFLYWTARTRFVIDMQVFQAAESSLAPCLATFERFEQRWTAEIVGSIMKAERAMAIFRTWQPEITEAYAPSWPGSTRLAGAEQQILDSAKTEALVELEGFFRACIAPDGEGDENPTLTFRSFLDSRGKPKPASIKERKEAARLRWLARLDAVIDAALKRWKAALPPVLLPAWGKIDKTARSRELGRVDCSEMEAILEKEYADPIDRLRVLTGWVGSVDESWDRSVGLDRVPGRIFYTFTDEQRLQLLDDPKLTEKQLDGAVRLFTYLYEEQETAPKLVAKRILKLCDRSKHEYNRTLCRATFDPAFTKPVRVFGEFDFGEGGYALVGYRVLDQSHPISKRVGNFYVNNPAVMKQIRATWLAGKDAPYFACGYHYYLDLARNGQVVANYAINLEEGCNTIVDDAGKPRWFTGKQIERFAAKYKKPKIEHKKFATREAALEYVESIADNPLLLAVDVREWPTYEGRFDLTVPCSKKKDDGYADVETCSAEVEAMIREKYPDERFEIHHVFSTDDLLQYSVTSLKTLYEKIELPSAWRENWHGLEQRLTIAWKKR